MLLETCTYTHIDEGEQAARKNDAHFHLIFSFFSFFLFSSFTRTEIICVSERNSGGCTCGPQPRLPPFPLCCACCRLPVELSGRSRASKGKTTFTHPRYSPTTCAAASSNVRVSTQTDLPDTHTQSVCSTRRRRMQFYYITVPDGDRPGWS